MRLRFSAALSSLLLLATVPAFALEPYLVKDINPIPDNTSSNPREFQALSNGIGLFLADDEHEQELWRSDGTAAGTYRLTETCEGSYCGEKPIFSFARAGDRLFFVAAQELWVTGGSTETTIHLTGPLRIYPYYPRLWMEKLGLLFFVADDGEHGEELWRSDGTPEGTYMFADLLPGTRSSFPYELTEFKGGLYFAGQDSRGPALWTSDGTPKGTKLVKDLVPGSREFGAPSGMRSIGSALVFFGSGGVLWRSDGTAQGTKQVVTLGPRQGLDWDAIALAGRYYFMADFQKLGEELWVSDGTRTGTRRLTDFVPLHPFSFINQAGERESLLLPTLAAGIHLVFWVDDGVHGVEPWGTQGTPTGTRLLRDVCPGPCSSDPLERAALGSRLIFTAKTPSQGRESWTTDGTPAGTRILRDICSGDCWSLPFGFTELNGRLIFGAGDATNGYQLWKTDGSPRGTVRVTSFPEDVSSVTRLGAPIPGAVLYAAWSRADGLELWRTDGTAAGTSLVKDLVDIDMGGSQPRDLFAYRGDLFFMADDGVHGRELWRSDGTDEGTTLVDDASTTTVNPPGRDSSAIAGHAEIGGLLFLLRSTPDGAGLWRTDGTEAGTVRLTPPAIYSVGWLRVAGSRMFFLASDEEHGPELWTSDGTIEGTRLLEIQPGPAGQLLNEVAVVQGNVYFAVQDPSTYQRSIWRSDGTPAGTAPVPFLPSGAALDLLGEFKGRLWFTTTISGVGATLWSTDGTEAGTTPLETVEGSFPVARLIPAGTRMFLLLGLSDLWVSDGTAAGTRRVGIADHLGELALVHGGRLFYQAGHDIHYQVLWTSDGTEEGTEPLLNAEGEPFSPSEMFVFSDRVWFVAGEKVWQTDGTSAGTVEVDVELKGNLLTPVGDRLFFSRWDPAIGWELWAVDPR